MEGEEKKELSHEPIRAYIPVFWIVVAMALFYLLSIAFKIIS